MFKDNKDKGINHISTEEIEKMYEFQRKAFDAKILEQQGKIDELTDYISARFGENISKSNIGLRLSNIEKNLNGIQNKYEEKLATITKELKQQIKEENEKIAAELNDTHTEAYFKLLQKNDSALEKIQNTIAENMDNVEKISELDVLINNCIKDHETYKTENKNEINGLKKKIDKINYTGITNKYNKKIKDECNKLKKQLEENNEQIKSEVVKHSEDIINLVGSLDERLSTEVALTNEHLEETINQNNSKNAKTSEEVTSVNKKVDNINKNLNEIKEKSNEDNELLKTKVDEDLNKLRGLLNENIKKTQITLNENIKKVNIKLDEKIENYKKDEKIELQNISLAVDIIKNTMDENFGKIGQELLELKENNEKNLEKQASNITDIEELKKDYNKYVTKMNNELAKINKSIMNAQKKNLEANQNLQAKIKTYIDNKIAKTDNTKKFEDIINNLNTSIQEREKTQKLEMEEIINNLDLAIREREKTQQLEMKGIINNLETVIQQKEQAQRQEMEELFNKKIKAIQKENERILNKKIEEIGNKFIKENTTSENTLNENTNPNKVTFYTESPKRKKNVYELIDEEQILRKTARNKGNLQMPQEGKSQILKFFYDEED